MGTILKKTNSGLFFSQLTDLASVNQALHFLKDDNQRTAKEQTVLTEIDAPPFHEQARAEWMADQFKMLGLTEVTIDAEGSVSGEWPGEQSTPKTVLSAHLDTVFDPGTPVKADIRDGIIHAPGISDDGRGLACLLTVIRALRTAGIKPLHSLLFVATVGEEGLGDLRGVKALFKQRHDIGAFLSIEPGPAEYLTCTAVGSRRYRVSFKGPGGHSFASFGLPSAIHAMGRAIAAISDITVPRDPRTTFTVGKVGGGTSVNSIAEDAEMLLDLRSVSGQALTALEDQAFTAIHKAVADENRRWNAEDAISVQLKPIGNRPAGTQSTDATIIDLGCAAVAAFGRQAELKAASTDSNVPISLGIPALTLSGGGVSGNEHTLEEFFDPTDAHIGPQIILLIALAISGISGESASQLFN
ncbi:MAG: M20/M25/M40 family metallo-hydrolase [Sporolactobacillus sp.]